MKRKSTIIAVGIAFIVLIIPAFSFWLIEGFLGRSFHFLVPAIFLLLLGLTGTITYSIANKDLYKKTIIAISFAMVLSFGLIVGENYYKEKYIPSITLGQTINYWRTYLPFRNSEYLYRLEDGSELKFSKDDELPRVDGATALFPVYCSFVENTYPPECQVTDFVSLSTTSKAYENLISGETDIIFVAEPSEEQLKAASDNGVEFNMHPIGYEAFVFIVNKKNPVSNITIRQIKDIYTGKINNWKELGGKNRKIRPFQRDKNSGSQTAFTKLMGKDVELIPPEMHQIAGMEGLIDVVSDYENHDNALGYSFRYFVEFMHKNKNIKVLKLNGIEPSIENIQNGTYPVTGNFYAITVKNRETENSLRFIEWIRSQQGQQIIKEVGYVPLY